MLSVNPQKSVEYFDCCIRMYNLLILEWHTHQFVFFSGFLLFSSTMDINKPYRNGKLSHCK